MRKIAVFLAGPAEKNFFLLFLAKTFSLGLFRNFLDHAIQDPRHPPQKVPVPPASTYIIKEFIYQQHGVSEFQIPYMILIWDIFYLKP